MQTRQSPPTRPRTTTTNEIARRFGVKPDTVRRNFCVSGHFLGLQPLKLPNKRLLWPDIQPEELVSERC
jgi:hypothetical protein